MRLALLAVALLFSFCTPSSVRAGKDTSVWATPHSEQDMDQIPEWRPISHNVFQPWHKLDVVGLEALLSIDPTLAASDGSSLQDLAFRSIANFVAGTEVIHPSKSKYDPVLAEWRRKFPHSAAPDIINAMLLFRYANHYYDTGNGGRNMFSGFDPAQSGLTEAKSVLERSEAYAKAYPHWYTLMIQIEAARKTRFDDLFILADTARTMAPNYIDPQTALIEHLLTNVGWSRTYIERTVRSLSFSRDGRIDPVRYARIYRAAFASVYHYRLFETSDADWTIMR